MELEIISKPVFVIKGIWILEVELQFELISKAVLSGI